MSAIIYKYHIVYKTINLINNYEYIGIHSTNDINDGYIGSGIKLKQAISEYGKPNFNREVLNICETRQQALDIEKKLVDKWYVLRCDTYNLELGGHQGNSLSYWTEENRKRLSDKKKGIPRAKETVAKMLATKIKNGSTRKGCSFSDTHKKNISKSCMGRQMPKVTCPHCNKTGDIGNMKRWHFDNCKDKK